VLREFPQLAEVKKQLAAGAIIKDEVKLVPRLCVEQN
jgi:hypothetical protein